MEDAKDRKNELKKGNIRRKEALTWEASAVDPTAWSWFPHSEYEYSCIL
jgi:hypothetical protein